MSSESEKVYTVKAVVNGVVTEYETNVIKWEIVHTYAGPQGKPERIETLNELAGEADLSQKDGDIWDHKLRDHKANDGQEQALLQLTPWFADRGFLPEKKLKPGASWEIVAATQIKKLVLNGGTGAQCPVSCGPLSNGWIHVRVFAGRAARSYQPRRRPADRAPCGRPPDQIAELEPTSVPAVVTPLA